MRIASACVLQGVIQLLKVGYRPKLSMKTVVASWGSTCGRYGRIHDGAIDDWGFGTASYVSYNLLALICCATLIPLTLTRVPQPETKSPAPAPHVGDCKSPLATAGVIVAAPPVPRSAWLAPSMANAQDWWPRKSPISLQHSFWGCIGAGSRRVVGR